MSHFYANSLDLVASPYDVQLRFSRKGVVSKPDDGPPVAGEIEHMVVSMSIAHLKAMLPALVDAVVKFEAQMGTVGIPEEFQKTFDQVVNKAGVKL
jgi:hypothetical protein